MKVSLFTLLALLGIVIGGCGGVDRMATTYPGTPPGAAPGTPTEFNDAFEVGKIGPTADNYDINGGGFFSGGIVFRLNQTSYLRSDVAGVQTSSPIGFWPVIASNFYSPLDATNSSDEETRSAIKGGWKFGWVFSTGESFVTTKDGTFSGKTLSVTFPEGMRLVRILDVDPPTRRVLLWTTYRSQNWYAIKKI